MSDCKPVSSSAIPHTKQCISDCPIEGSEKSLDFCEQKQYRTLVGNLMLLSVVSRPDICFAVYYLAQFVSNPGEAHWCALKHLLRFLKSTESVSLIFLIFRIPIGPPTRTIASQLRVFASNYVVLVVLSLGRPISEGVWHLALVKLSMFRWIWLHRKQFICKACSQYSP